MVRSPSLSPLQVELDFRRRALGWSMRRLSTHAGLSEGTLKKIMSGESRRPRHDTLERLAGALGCTLADLLAADGPLESARAPGPAAVMVRGRAQAGVWRPSAWWDRRDWYPLPTTEDPRFPGAFRWALEVRGPAMDRVYPDPSVVIVVDYLELKRGPASGDRVVCRCRDRRGRYEVTIEAYEEDDTGKAWLWPRSRDPRFQSPLALDLADDPARAPEVVVVARVVESLCRE